MIEISHAVALAALSMLVGGAVAWGVLRSTVAQLQQAVSQLTRDVRDLTETVADLRTEVAVIKAVESRADATARQRPGKP
jgi:uncharacterized protein YlxW (UPF0749 family)